MTDSPEHIAIRMDFLRAHIRAHYTTTAGAETRALAPPDAEALIAAGRFTIDPNGVHLHNGEWLSRAEWDALPKSGERYAVEVTEWSMPEQPARNRHQRRADAKKGKT